LNSINTEELIVVKQISHLPLELKALVRDCVSILGDVIREEGGKELYQEVEKIRKKMIEYRQYDDEKKFQVNQKLLKLLKNNSKKQKHQIAHSFTLMMELINTCEAAYRTFKLKKTSVVEHSGRQDNMMVYVLTAHPTEARTPQNIELFRRVQAIAIRILDGTGEKDYMQTVIKHHLKIAWLLPVTRHEKPEVVDEANH
jgi:phosphoenolpyruvate carboxylase